MKITEVILDSGLFFAAWKFLKANVRALETHESKHRQKKNFRYLPEPKLKARK